MTKPYIRRIIERRTQLGWSQAKLAQELQLHGLVISRAAIGKLELGLRRIEPDDLVYFALALGVEPNWLVRWEERKHKR